MSLFSITAKASGWKALISSLRCISEEASFKVTDNGINFHCMDPSHISLLSMDWEKQNMDELTLDVPEKIIGFRTDDLDKIFKRFSPDDNVRVWQDDEKDVTLHITSKNKKFDISTLIDAKLGDTPVPKFTHDVIVSTSPDELKKAINDVSLFTDDYIHFIAQNGMIYLQSDEDEGKCKSDIATKEINIIKDADATYDTSNITAILSAISTLCDKIIISYGAKTPILLELVIKNSGTMRYYLGAKVIR